MQRSLEQEVAHLKRRLEREKKARESAEQLLDDYAKKTFIANEKLREAVAEVELRQHEIEFFVKSTTESTSAESNQTLVESLLELSATFINAKFAAIFYTKNGTQYGDPRVIRNTSETVNVSSVANLIPFDIDGPIPYWCIQEVSDEESQFSTWLVYLNFKYIDQVDGWLAMLIDSPMIDEEKLYVLDAHIAQLRHSLEKLNNDNLRASETKEAAGLKDELSDAHKQLAIADRMSSLGILASGVAHEINNPLAFISANNKYLKQALLPAIGELKALAGSLAGSEAGVALEKNNLVRMEDAIAEVLQDNMDGVERLSKISDSLRTFVHTSNKEFKLVDLNKVVKDTVKVASFSKEFREDIEIQLFDDTALVEANAGEIEQVLLNIIINAIHATQEDGGVAVNILRDGKYFTINVKDEGVGISEANLAKIFSPFFTTKAVGKGTGLGLAISKNIIEAHGGLLKVDSTVDVGTCFSIMLPQATKKKETEAME
ncbi:sensor histidine kinase [Alteromonas gracilis]|uniref:sensor histidine kinase n=1 Tax=Alteromonas gracilis TaxID=1479524 RepID=UPI003219781E